jgi:hypothetical protein
VVAFFFYYFEKLGVLPEIEKVKKCVEQIASLGDKIGAPLSDLDDKLAEEMAQLSYAMFCYHKKDKKTFTVCENSKLKKMRISEDADGFNEEETLFLMIFFKNNLDAYVELVARSYLPLQSQLSAIPRRLFYAEVYSRYSGNKQPLFFASKDGEFYVFDEKLTENKLPDYISDYFSATTSSDPEIRELTTSLNTQAKSFAEMQKFVTETFVNFNKRVMNRYDFIPGAITFMDFLAWKGLWQQSHNGEHTLERVSGLIDEFRQKLDDLSQNLFVQAKGIRLSKLISISDTIAIFSPKASIISECQLLELHAELSQFILVRCTEEKYPIRGAIAFGEYSIMNNIMIGPGIDECASWHETGNWIGVHLTPTAQIHWINQCTVSVSDNIKSNYQIPLKDGLKADYCIQWNVSKDVFMKLALNTRALLPEIANKYTNTYNFLANTAWKEADTDGEK